MSELEEQAIAAWAELRRKRGALTKIARRLNIKPQAVHVWKTIPPDRVWTVAKLMRRPWRSLRPDKAHLSDDFVRGLARERARELANGDLAASPPKHRKLPPQKSSQLEKHKRGFVKLTKDVGRAT